MTNIAARDSSGVVMYLPGKGCGMEDETEAASLLSNLGYCIRAESETQIDVVTAVSGSGIAYLIEILRDFIGSSQKYLGKEAEEIVLKTAESAIGMIRSGKDNIEEIASKGGTTEQGLIVLRKGRLISRVIEKTIEKCKSIGDSYE